MNAVAWFLGGSLVGVVSIGFALGGLRRNTECPLCHGSGSCIATIAGRHEPRICPVCSVGRTYLAQNAALDADHRGVVRLDDRRPGRGA